MTRAIAVGVLAAPLLALAAPKEAPKPAAVPEAECEMHKAGAAVAEAAAAGKGKLEMVDLSTGHAILVWVADPKALAALEAAMGPMGAVESGKSKLCELHGAIMAAVKAGKAVLGTGKLPMGFIMTGQSADPAVAKLFHDATVQFMAAKAAAPAPAVPDPAAAPPPPEKEAGK